MCFLSNCNTHAFFPIAANINDVCLIILFVCYLFMTLISWIQIQPLKSIEWWYIITKLKLGFVTRWRTTQGHWKNFFLLPFFFFLMEGNVTFPSRIYEVLRNPYHQYHNDFAIFRLFCCLQNFSQLLQSSADVLFQVFVSFKLYLKSSTKILDEMYSLLAFCSLHEFSISSYHYLWMTWHIGLLGL